MSLHGNSTKKYSKHSNKLPLDEFESKNEFCYIANLLNYFTVFSHSIPDSFFQQFWLGKRVRNWVKIDGKNYE